MRLIPAKSVREIPSRENIRERKYSEYCANIRQYTTVKNKAKRAVHYMKETFSLF